MWTQHKIVWFTSPPSVPRTFTRLVIRRDEISILNCVIQPMCPVMWATCFRPLEYHPVFKHMSMKIPEKNTQLQMMFIGFSSCEPQLFGGFPSLPCLIRITRKCVQNHRGSNPHGDIILVVSSTIGIYRVPRGP